MRGADARSGDRSHFAVRRIAERRGASRNGAAISRAARRAAPQPQDVISPSVVGGTESRFCAGFWVPVPLVDGHARWEREAVKDDRGLPDMVAARYRGGEIVQLHAMKTVNMGN